MAGAGRQALQGLGAVREVAVQRAVDPVSLEELRARPGEVGALLFDGRRVEPALYHCRSVLGPDGELCVRGGVSPVTREPVNGFQLAPPLIDAEGLAEFLDWDEDGVLSLGEVSTALAALLPVDEERIEHFLRHNFQVDEGGRVRVEELLHQILPYCSARLGELQRAAPVDKAPEIWRGAGRAELLAWFDHWDSVGSGELDLRDMRFAIASLLYRACGSSADHTTKEAAAALFLAEVDLLGDGGLTREAFAELVAPALQANLPDRPRHGAAGSGPGGGQAATAEDDDVEEHMDGRADDVLRLAVRASPGAEDGGPMVLEAMHPSSSEASLCSVC